jgi:hypothetical protein
MAPGRPTLGIRLLDYVYQVIDMARLSVRLSRWCCPATRTPPTVDDPGSGLKSLTSRRSNARLGLINHFSFSGFGYSNQEQAVAAAKSGS